MQLCQKDVHYIQKGGGNSEVSSDKGAFIPLS